MNIFKAFVLTTSLMAWGSLNAMEVSKSAEEQKEEFSALIDKLSLADAEDTMEEYVKIAKAISAHPYRTTFFRYIGRANVPEKDFALLLATHFDHENMVKKLLQAGANPNVHQRAALNAALEMGYINNARLLVGAGAEIDNNHLLTAVMRASQNGDYSSLIFISQNNPTVFVDHYRNLVKSYGSIKVAVKNYLLKKGEELEKTTKIK